MSYNAANVHDLTGPANGGTFTNTTGSNPYEPHPWGGVPGLFKQFSVESGLSYDVSISARNAASLQGHYTNSSPAGWDLRGNLASRAWDTVVLQDNSTQALPSGSGTVTFAAGSATATLTLTPTADTKIEADETVGITLASGTGYRVGTTGKVIGTILNDDPTAPVVNPALPTVTLKADPGAVLEDAGGQLVYTFTRTGPTNAALTIDFAVARDGSTAPSVAASGGDFVASSGSIYSFKSGIGTTTGSISFTSGTGTITIAAGATTATVTLVPKADADVEADESLRFTVKSSAAYNVGTPGAVTATILNDDFASGTDLTVPNITLGLADSSVYENGAGKLVYQFTRSGSTASALTVKFGVDGTATLPGQDFTVSGADAFKTAGAANPDLASFNTYAVKLAQYATLGAADGAIPANPNANAATDVYLYETWARPNLVTGALVATTNDTTGAITNTATTAAEYYATLEDMTADLRAAYEGLAAANPIFKGVAPVGAAFLAAVQNGTAIRDPYTTPAGTGGKVDLWWDDNLHASKYGSYLSGLTLYGTITGLDPRSLGAVDKVASDLGIDPAVATALQAVAAATVGFTSQAHWTAPGRVTELATGATGVLASAGAFTFSDANKTATHAIAVTPDAGVLGTLAATLRTDSTGDGTGGAVNWTYTVDDAAVNFLAAGQTRAERFQVTVSDQNGGTVQRTVTVTITGTNDAPVVSGAASANATGGGAKVAIDAFARASDVDQGTTLSVVDLPTTLPPGVTYDVATHSFILDPSNAAYQALPSGQQTVIAVQYAVSDGIADPVAASLAFTVDPAPPTPPATPTAGGTVTPPAGQTQTLSGVTSGSLTVDGGGTLVLTGASTYAGPTDVKAGTLLVNGSIVSPVNVGSGATLGGSGSTGTVTVAAGGTLSPGNSPGILSTKDLSLAAGAVLKEEIGGTASGQFDQTKVTGGVSLNGAKLDAVAFNGFTASRGNSFVLIDNDGTDAVQGTFAGLAEAGTVNVGTHALRISYHGGDGNDVVLTDVTGNAAVFGRIETSAASAAGTVYGLYEAVLGRAPDPLGLTAFAGSLQNGARPLDVAAAILASPEYAARATTGAQFVEGLYVNLLHRASDAVGQAFFTGELAAGVSREQVVVQVATSAEAQGVLKPAFDAGVSVPDASTAAVARLYYGLLNRAPDTAGLQAFSGQVGQAVSTGGADGGARALVGVTDAMLASNEYVLTHANLTDAAFVDSLYLGALGRRGEATGSAYWTDQLSHGASRAVVATQIAESAEAQVHLVGQIELGQYLIA